MPKVTFKFDKERDIQNVWQTANSKLTYGMDFKKNLTPKILIVAEGKGFDDCKKDIQKTLEYIHNSAIMSKFVESANLLWDSIEEEYFKRLVKVMKKPICSEKFTGYVTTVGKCPYHTADKTFMIPFFGPTLGMLRVTGHELMHFQFHYYYWDKVEQQIGKEKTTDLKEALTVLLNLEFKDLWFVEDIGYENHKELRQFIEEEWKKEKDFDILLDKCVEYLRDR